MIEFPRLISRPFIDIFVANYIIFTKIATCLTAKRTSAFKRCWTTASLRSCTSTPGIVCTCMPQSRHFCARSVEVADLLLHSLHLQVQRLLVPDDISGVRVLQGWVRLPFPNLWTSDVPSREEKIEEFGQFDLVSSEVVKLSVSLFIYIDGRSRF